MGREDISGGNWVLLDDSEEFAVGKEPITIGITISEGIAGMLVPGEVELAGGDWSKELLGCVDALGIVSTLNCEVKVAA